MTSQMVYLTLCGGKNWRGVWEESVPQTKGNIMRKRIKENILRWQIPENLQYRLLPGQIYLESMCRWTVTLSYMSLLEIHL